MSTRRIRFTRANALTLLRVLLAPALALAILEGEAAVATVIFWVAVATDVTDGRVARRRGEVSEHGRLIDHSADAVFVSIGAAALACVGALPHLLAPLIALAFVQYAVDSSGADGREPRASRLGHWNGIAYYVAVRDADHPRHARFQLARPGARDGARLAARRLDGDFDTEPTTRLAARRIARGSRGAGTAGRSPR